MITIQVEVSPAMVNKVGIEALRQRLQRTVQLEELAILAKEMDKKIRDAGIDLEKLTEQARQEAWEELKAAHLKKTLG